MRTRSVLLGLASLLVAASFAHATTLLVDRGLPTYGVATGADWGTSWSTQNNFASADLDYKDAGNGGDNPNVPGDDFTLPTDNSYHVTDIRMWVQGMAGKNYSDEFNNIGLMIGPKGGQLTAIPGIVPTVTAVGFPNGGTGGNRALLYQLDYAVDFTAAAGQGYSYAIAPDAKLANGSQGSHAYYLAFLEATALRAQNGFNPSGDGVVSEYNYDNGIPSQYPDGTTALTWQFGVQYGGVPNGDYSVQVFGDAVPEPITMSLVGMGIFGLGGYIRRRVKVAK